MKKVLFVTTALIATASMASADVRLSGYGRFGLDYNEANGNIAGRSSTNLTTRLRLQFDMSTETDNGVAFGARFRAQAEQRDSSAGGAVFNGGRFYATTGGFTLQVGNIIGAMENSSGLYLETRTADIGIDGAGFESNVLNANGEAFNWDSYSSGGAGTNNGIEVLYHGNGFNAHVSYSSNSGTLIAVPVPGSAAGRDRAAISGAYTFGDWTIGASYQNSNVNGEDKGFISIAGDFGQFGVRLAYGDNDGISKYGLYGNVDIGAAGNLVAFVTNEDSYNPTVAEALARPDAGTDGTGYGLNYSYDLGGGVSFEAGWISNSVGNDTVQAGVYFSF